MCEYMFASGGHIGVWSVWVYMGWCPCISMVCVCGNVSVVSVFMGMCTHTLAQVPQPSGQHLTDVGGEGSKYLFMRREQIPLSMLSS